MRAARVLPEGVKRYAALLGVQPASVRVTRAKTRFGSCSTKGALCFSLRLFRYPKEAVDYVIVHELAHLIHPDHSPAFHRLVASVFPDHKARRALLKKPPEASIPRDA